MADVRKVSRCAVAGSDIGGDSDILFVRVMATDEEVHKGLHKDAAMCFARSQGWGPEMVAFDENDRPPIAEWAVWDSTSVINAGFRFTSPKRVGAWVGVDLDATLAEYKGWKGPLHIGDPIPLAVARVKQLLAGGMAVRILTARVARPSYEANGLTLPEVLAPIEDWCKAHIGCVLPVTCVKDVGMIDLLDDRVTQMIPNTGVAVKDLLDEARAALVVASETGASTNKMLEKINLLLPELS